MLSRRAGALEDGAGEVVAVGVLLPVEEVVGRVDAQRVAADGGAAMRRRSQPDDVRRQGHAPVVGVARPVVDGDLDAHGSDDARARRPPIMRGGRPSGARNASPGCVGRGREPARAERGTVPGAPPTGGPPGRCPR